MDCLSFDSSNALNSLFTTKGIDGILEGKYYRYVEYAFLIIAVFIKQTCRVKDSMTSAISILYIALINQAIERP